MAHTGSEFFGVMVPHPLLIRKTRPSCRRWVVQRVRGLRNKCLNGELANKQKIGYSTAEFRSQDRWVMGPAR